MRFIEYLANMFGTDVRTTISSIFNGTFSTAVGIELSKYKILTIGTFNFEFEKHIVGMFWAVCTCIVITVLSFCLNEMMKSIKAKIKNRKDKKNGV